jgi:uncharacterized CHY-type Zn-finger protein
MKNQITLSCKANDNLIKTLNKQGNVMSSTNDNSSSLVECPYCQSKFKDKADLSKHIDRIHTGSGLLEGDRRKW